MGSRIGSRRAFAQHDPALSCAGEVCHVGLFNTVYQRLLCPYCTRFHEFESEFRYGTLKLSRYRVGDALVWGDYPETGSPIHNEVIVLGLTIPSCFARREDRYQAMLTTYIHVHYGRIRRVWWSNGGLEWLIAENDLVESDGLRREYVEFDDVAGV